MTGKLKTELGLGKDIAELTELKESQADTGLGKAIHKSEELGTVSSESPPSKELSSSHLPSWFLPLNFTFLR